MLVLGLSTFGKNPAACLLKNGKLVAFAEEERFIRLKGAEGRFPGRAIGYCLDEAGALLAEVEKIAVGWDCEKYRITMPLFFARSWWQYGRLSRGSAYGEVWNEIINQQPGFVRHRIKLELRKTGHSGQIPPIEFIPHHLAHAASTYYASGFDDAAILIMDGSGEERATTIFRGKGDSIDEVAHVDIPDSLGWFYAALTAYLGFIPYQQDGYLMGLAPYGKLQSEVREKIEKLLVLDQEGKYQVDPSYTLLGKHGFNEYFSDQLVNLLGPPRLYGQPITQRHKNIAYAIQSRLEEAALALARTATKNGRVRKLCLAGGVALNCKMNGLIVRSGMVDELFVQPVSHDAGAALGAAMIAACESGYDPRFRMDHVRLGPSFSSEAVQKVLKNASVQYKCPASIEKKAADAIAAGKVVAWFQGRMEVGPRALGGRSILADASRVGINDHINTRVKYRDPWRPFCPSFTEASASAFFQGKEESDYMIVAYPVSQKRQNDIPAVVHVDGSIRPQTVRRQVDQRYHRLIESVGKKTGVETVLNTSFNVKGEPIVCTPSDALRCFFSTGLDALAIEGFWVEKT